MWQKAGSTQVVCAYFADRSDLWTDKVVIGRLTVADTVVRYKAAFGIRVGRAACPADSV